jgi:hypothetical protein
MTSPVGVIVQMWLALFSESLLEGDALHVVHALRKEEKNSCIYGQLIDDAGVMLNSLQN